MGQDCRIVNNLLDTKTAAAYSLHTPPTFADPSLVFSTECAMSWRAEIAEIERRRVLAEACGGAEAVAKHHAAGKLTVRERIERLLDAGTFREVGKLAG